MLQHVEVEEVDAAVDEIWFGRYLASLSLSLCQCFESPFLILHVESSNLANAPGYMFQLAGTCSAGEFDRQTPPSLVYVRVPLFQSFCCAPTY